MVVKGTCPDSTRWLTRHQAIKRVALCKPRLVAYITDVLSEETVPRKKKVNNEEVSPEDKKSEQRTLKNWYSIILFSETKAYLLFLRCILNIFSTFSAFFQSSKTRVYLLQPSSKKLPIQLLRLVSKLAFLNHIDEIKNIKFEQPHLREKINLGENCNAI